MSNYENVQGADIENKSMTGSGVEYVTYADGLRKTFEKNQIVINGLATGTATIKAKGRNSDVFEDVVNGVIELSTTRTLTIEDAMIEEFSIEVSAGTAYTVSVFQSDHRRGGLNK